MIIFYIIMQNVIYYITFCTNKYNLRIDIFYVK